MSKRLNDDVNTLPGISRRVLLGHGAVIASALGTGLWKPTFAQTTGQPNYYIGPNGSDSNPGTAESPWAVTALNTKRSTYAGRVVGFLDGTYDVSAIAPTRGFETPIFNIAGGTSSSPTVLKSVNARGAHITAKTTSGAYTGMNSSGGGGVSEGGLLGNVSGVALGNIVFDGLRLSGTKNCLIRIGTLPSSTSLTYITGVVIQNCELFDTNAMGTVAGENYCAISMHGNSGTVIRNNYIHDIVGTGGPTSSDHTSAVVQWGCINMLYEYNSLIKCAALYSKRGYGRGQWGATIRYNYIDASNYGTSGSSGIADFAGGTEVAVQPGTVLRVHNNVIIASKPLNFLSTNGYGQRIQSETLECYNNTCIIDTAVGAGRSWGAFFQISNPGAKFYNNLFWGLNGSNVATATIEFGMLVISNGPHQILDFNVYPSSANKFSRFANGGSPYDGSLAGGSTLAAWRTSLGLLGSLLSAVETNSSLTSNPQFTNSGVYAERFKLQSTSPLMTAGRTNGTSTGSVVEVGAWAGASRIGHYFGPITIPNSPSSVTVS